METDEDTKPVNFHEMGLDDRILKAIAKLGWCQPTLIQQKAIPFILEGKDVLAKGRTGSGKTGAFAIPVIQKILDAKKSASEQSVKALLLAPSRELAGQIHEAVVDLTRNCGRVVRSVDVSTTAVGIEAQKALLVGDLPDIVVGTPSRVLAHIKAENLNLSESLETLVIDEADLIFSFGHEADLRAILTSGLPSTYQAVLTSATLSEDVTQLKKLVLHNPVSLKLEEPSLPDSSQLTQYKIIMEQEEKFVLIYALFKLKLIQGKTIIFVNNVDRCYQIKLYLEQFGIPVCVLNSELPTASRCHIVQQFNKGIYEVIVASDEKFLVDVAAQETSKRAKDKESGVARGIDFQFVSNVINFDFPLDTDSYIHRVGRTARGNNKGTALSLIAGKELDRATTIETDLKEREGLDTVFKPYHFK
jgi:ATP-dependent RNA helicase DDX56/DBP9